MKLTKINLKRIILEEMTRLQEEREVEAIMKRVLGERHDQWARGDYGHAEALRKDANYDRHHGHIDWADDDKDHASHLKGDAHYDKEDELDWMYNHMEEAGTTSIAPASGGSDNDPWDDPAVVSQEVESEEKDVAGPDNIGENTDHLSRGSLYRRRYYGRY